MDSVEEAELAEQVSKQGKIKSKFQIPVDLFVAKTNGAGVKLDALDHEHIADLWDNVINLKCIEFGKETGKPPEAF